MSSKAAPSASCLAKVLGSCLPPRSLAGSPHRSRARNSSRSPQLQVRSRVSAPARHGSASAGQRRRRTTSASSRGASTTSMAAELAPRIVAGRSRGDRRSPAPRAWRARPARRAQPRSWRRDQSPSSRRRSQLAGYDADLQDELEALQKHPQVGDRDQDRLLLATMAVDQLLDDDRGRLRP